MTVHWSYDITTGAVYIRVADEAIAAQRAITDALILDLDAVGGIVGIEVLSPSGRRALLANLDVLDLEGFARDLAIRVATASIYGQWELVTDEPPTTLAEDLASSQYALAT